MPPNDALLFWACPRCRSGREGVRLRLHREEAGRIVVVVLAPQFRQPRAQALQLRGMRRIGGEVAHLARIVRQVVQLLLLRVAVRSEEHTSELQSLMRISYAVFCLKKKIKYDQELRTTNTHTKVT